MPNSEHEHQVALFAWAMLAAKRHPELALLFAVPNAAKRSPRLGAYMKAEGLRAGVPDIFLPISRGGYGCLAIELKTPKGTATPEQKAWVERLNEYGNYAVVCKGWELAKDAIEKYLALPVAVQQQPTKGVR